MSNGTYVLYRTTFIISASRSTTCSLKVHAVGSHTEMWLARRAGTNASQIILSDINLGKLTEKTQLSTRHSNKVLATEWCQLLTHGYYRVGESTRLVIPERSVQWIAIHFR